MPDTSTTESTTTTPPDSGATSPPESGTTGTDQLGESGQRALRAEREARRQAEQQATELRQRLEAIEDTQRTDGEKALRRAEKAETNVQALSGERDQLVAGRDRLTAVLLAALGEETTNRLTKAAQRLVGSTPQEWAADAADLLAGISPNGQQQMAPRPDRSQGQRGGGGSDMNSIIRGLAGHGT